MSKHVQKFQISKKEIFYSRFDTKIAIIKQKHQRIVDTGSTSTLLGGVVKVGIGAVTGGAIGQLGGQALGSATTGQVLGSVTGGGIAVKKAYGDYNDNKEEIQKSDSSSFNA